MGFVRGTLVNYELRQGSVSRPSDPGIVVFRLEGCMFSVG
jgi:hypothetical protein